MPFAYRDKDLVARARVHDLTDFQSVEVLNMGDIRSRQQFFISCGATLRRGGYAVRKGFPPLSTVFPTLTLHGDGYKHMTASAAN